MAVRFFLLLIFSGATGNLLAQPVHDIWSPPLKQGIAAEVETKIITFEEIRREMAPLMGQLQETVRSEEELRRRTQDLYREVLQNLIDRVLIVQEFYDKEYRLPGTVVEDELDRILIQEYDNNRARFLQYLQAEGMTMREFKQELYEGIVVSIMRGEKRKSMSQISPERIEAFYAENKLHFYEEEAVKLRIIMLRPLADESDDLMRQNIERVMAELESGRTFADVATQYSQDSRRRTGGDWGWIERTDLRAELAEVAFALGPGSTSDPVQIGNQTFILHVENRRDEGIQDLAAVRDRIEEILSNQLARQAQDQWLERLRREAFIKYY